jgi:hypothetical protein
VEAAARQDLDLMADRERHRRDAPAAAGRGADRQDLDLTADRQQRRLDAPAAPG